MPARVVLAWMIAGVLMALSCGSAMAADGGIGQPPQRPGTRGGGGGIGESPREPVPEKAPSAEAPVPEQAPSAEAPAPEQAPSAEAPAPEQAPSAEAPVPRPPVAQAPPVRRPPATGYRPPAPTVSVPGSGYDHRERSREPVVIVIRQEAPPQQKSESWSGWKSMPKFPSFGGGYSGGSTYSSGGSWTWTKSKGSCK